MAYPQNCAMCPHCNQCDSYYGSPNCYYGTVVKQKENWLIKVLKKIFS